MYIKIKKATIWSSFFAYFLFSRAQWRRQKASLSEGGGKPIGLDGGSMEPYRWQCGGFYVRRTPSVSKLTAPSGREPCIELNGGDRKASLSEGGGKPNGLDGRSMEPYRWQCGGFYVRRTPSVSTYGLDSSLPEGACVSRETMKHSEKFSQ